MKGLIALNLSATSYNAYLLFHGPESIVSIVCYLISLFLFLGTLGTVYRRKESGLSVAFSTDVPVRLIRSGPYAYIRNPFYTAYLLAFFAPLCSKWDGLSALFFTAMLLVYYNAARLEEKKFASSVLKEEYVAYCASTGQFLPKFWRR